MLPSKLLKRESDFGMAFLCLSEGMHSWERNKAVLRASSFFAGKASLPRRLISNFVDLH